MLYYKASCTSAELEFRVAGVHTSRSSNRQKPKVQLSTSAKRGFCLKPETPLSTHEAPARAQVVIVLSCISTET